MAPKRRNQPTADRLASENAVVAGQPDEFSVDKLSASDPQVFDSGDERLYRDVEKLHLLGPWPLYHMLEELGCDRLIRVQIERLAARYAQLAAATVRPLQGDEFCGRPAMCYHPAKCCCTVGAAASGDAVSHDRPALDVGTERVPILGRAKFKLDDLKDNPTTLPSKRKPHGR